MVRGGKLLKLFPRRRLPGWLLYLVDLKEDLLEWLGRWRLVVQPRGRPGNPTCWYPSRWWCWRRWKRAAYVMCYTATPSPNEGGERVNETLRNVEIPPLALRTSSLTFGDWLATIEPIVADVSSSAGEWWLWTLKEVKDIYVQWSTVSPLERLRLDAGVTKEAIK